MKKMRGYMVSIDGHSTLIPVHSWKTRVKRSVRRAEKVANIIYVMHIESHRCEILAVSIGTRNKQQQEKKASESRSEQSLSLFGWKILLIYSCTKSKSPYELISFPSVRSLYINDERLSKGWINYRLYCHIFSQFQF